MCGGQDYSPGRDRMPISSLSELISGDTAWAAGEVGECQPSAEELLPWAEITFTFPPPMVGMEGLIEKTWPGGHTPNKSHIVL